jgi:cell wall-associated NlpC family hydrolase
VPAIPQAQLSTLRQQLVDAAIQAAKDSAGKPYTPNGRTTTGFDCSGFVTYVYKKVFPNYAHMNTDAIETSPLYKKVTMPRPGDLIFFPSGVNPYDKKSYPNHVGIVLDSGTWIGSQTSTGVGKVMLTNPWWSPRTKRFLQYTFLP